MLHRRVIYSLVLVAVFLFQITNQNYLARFLLALSIAMPLLSLLMSLPGMLSCRLSLGSAPGTVLRGEEGQWTLSVDNRIGLPIPRVTLRLEIRNLFTGQREKKRLVLAGLFRRRPMPRPADTARCGLLEFRAAKVRVYDYLGLFSIPRPLPEPARLLTLPVPIDPGPLSIPERQGLRRSPTGTAGRGRGEDYDLREYRPGDPMRSVHWKLSSKWDELIVREPTDTPIPLPLLTLDLFGPQEELETALDRLLGYCQAQLAVQRPHAVLWLNCEEPVLYTISDTKDLRDCLLGLLSSPAPERGVSILDRPELIRVEGQAVFHIHVDGRKEAPHD